MSPVSVMNIVHAMLVSLLVCMVMSLLIWLRARRSGVINDAMYKSARLYSTQAALSGADEGALYESWRWYRKWDIEDFICNPLRWHLWTVEKTIAWQKKRTYGVRE